MNISFKDDFLHTTDYYSTADRARGLAWLIVHERVWHILLPSKPRSVHIIQAGPEEAPEEPDGWQWCLDIDGQHYPIPSQRIVIHSGPTPTLPPERQYYERRCILYTHLTHNASKAAFGGTHGLHSGLQWQPHRLWLTNGTYVGYKPRGK